MDFGNTQTSEKLDISWIFSDAFNVVKGRLGEYAVMGLISVVASYVISYAINLPLSFMFGIANPQSPEAAMGMLGTAILVSLAANFISYGITFTLYAGVMVFTLKLLRGETAKFEDFFAGFKNFGVFFVAGVLYTVSAMLGVLACFVGTIFVSGILMFMAPLIYDRKLSAIDAFKASIEALKSQWLMAGAYVFVCYLIGFLGILACCVGIFVTMPFAYAAQAVAYQKLMGGPNGAQFLSPSQYPRDPNAMSNMPEAPSAWPSDAPSAPPAPEPPVAPDDEDKPQA